MCSCGCVTTMTSCPHKDNRTYVCYPTWQEMKAMIQEQTAAGKDEPAILQALAIRYGVQVLAAPPTKGFNLAAWILPGVGLLVGLAFAVVVARRLRNRVLPPAKVGGSQVDPKIRAAVEDEIKKAGLGVRD